MTTPSGPEHEFLPETCPMCWRQQRENEAAEGLRCANCLESFDKRYPFRSDSEPSLCFGCERVAKARKTAAGARYGTGRQHD